MTYEIFILQLGNTLGKSTLSEQPHIPVLNERTQITSPVIEKQNEWSIISKNIQIHTNGRYILICPLSA